MGIRFYFGVIVLASINATTFGQPKDTVYNKGYYPAYENDRSVYPVMEQTFTTYDPISYLTFPVISPIADRNIPLRNGEGTNGYILEGNINETFVLIAGKNQKSHFFRTFRGTINVGINLRLTQDDSAPLLPQNNKIGLGFEKILWNSHTSKQPGIFSKAHAFEAENWIDKKEKLRFFALGLLAQHYSNGQPPGFYFDSLGTRRNDYLSGDFSTNFIRVLFHHTRITPKPNKNAFGYLTTYTAGYQVDGGVGGPLKYSTEQNRSYGKHRLLVNFQKRFIIKGMKTRSVWIPDGGSARFNMRKIFDLSLRFNAEYITDSDLSEFRLAKKYRGGLHTYVQFTNVKWRSVYLVFHHYIGRDYLNIRYDDIINTWQLGLSFEIQKYQPPLTSKDFIIQ